MKTPASPAGRWLARVLWILTLGLAAAACWQLALHRQRSRQLESLRSEQARVARETRRLQLESDRDRARLAAALQEMQTLATSSTIPAGPDSELTAWLGRVERLKEWLRLAPEKAIPEMQYLNSNDWLAATLDNKLETDALIRTALARLRQMAKQKPEVAANISKALQDYAAAHDGDPAPDPKALAPYLKPSLPEEILQRYEALPEIPGKNDANGVFDRGARMTGSGRAVLGEKGPVDEDYDSLITFMKQGGFMLYSVSKLRDSVNEATKSYRAANPGRTPANADELIPFFTTGVDAQKLREFWAAERR